MSDEKVARVATGSTAEMSAAKAPASTGERWKMSPASPSDQISSQSSAVEIRVPSTANVQIVAKRPKKSDWLSEKPLSKMIGGSRNSVKNSGLK